MNNRLLEVIQYKTRGVQKEFAEMMGWSPQYLTKLLKEDFGLRPVVSILARFPDIDARWLLLGEGTMLNERRRDELRRTLYERTLSIMEAEKYIEVMTPEELRAYEQMVIGAREASFAPEQIAKWETDLAARAWGEKERLMEAMTKATKGKIKPDAEQG